MSSVRLEDYGIRPFLPNSEITPDISSYGLRPYPTASEELINKAKIAATPDEETKRNPQPQEEFSNPTIMPGFNDLPQKEKLQRIAFSQFDPANQTSTGTFVPPGTYENPVTRMVASTLPAMAMPETSLGNGIWSRYLLDPIENSLQRVMAGTASNLAYQSPNIQNKHQFSQAFHNDLTLNSLLEGGASLFRMPGYLGEMANPMKYAAQKSNQIKNEATAMQAVTDQMYKPVMDTYNKNNMTFSPKNYLKSAGIERKGLYSDAKIIYDKFMQEPNFENLHDLQSKLGKDWAKASTSPSTEEKAQLFRIGRDNLKDKIQNYLSQDKNSLNQYNAASNFSRDNLYPYYATPVLRKITKGKLIEDPNLLSKSIQKGIDKTTGSEERSAIPQDHPLRNHLNDLNHMINFGSFSKGVTPILLGELIHPGSAALGLGGAASGALISPYGNSILKATAQNPWLQNLSRRYINPLYYGGGRTYIGNLNQQG